MKFNIKFSFKKEFDLMQVNIGSNHLWYKHSFALGLNFGSFVKHFFKKSIALSDTFNSEYLGSFFLFFEIFHDFVQKKKEIFHLTYNIK